MRKLVTSACVGMLGLVLLQAQALRDKVIVDLPHKVTIDDKTTLEPGEYSIRQISDSGGGRYVLQIRKGDVEHEALVNSIPANQGDTQEDTRVVLHKLSDGQYRFDKIWVQGKDYGYEFPLPEAIRDRERERMSSTPVTARYESGEATPNQSGQVQNQSSVTSDQTSATASTETTRPADPAATTNENAKTAESSAAPAEPAVTPAETAQAQPQPAEPAQPQQQPAEPAPAETIAQTQPIPENQPSTVTAQSSGAEQGDEVAEALPQTASHWFGFVTAGLMLMGSGLALRRK